MSFYRIILLTILIYILKYKTDANEDTKLRKIYYDSNDHVLKWHDRHPGLILLRSKLIKNPNEIYKLLHSSSENHSSDQNRDALRKRAPSSESEQYNSTELEKIIFLPNNTHKYIKTAEIIDSSNEDVKDEKTVQSLREKEELKCIEACEEVLGNVCDKHRCGNKERHVFAKDCFNACDTRFRN